MRSSAATSSWSTPKHQVPLHGAGTRVDQLGPHAAPAPIHRLVDLSSISFLLDYRPATLPAHPTTGLPVATPCGTGALLPKPGTSCRRCTILSRRLSRFCPDVPRPSIDRSTELHRNHEILEDATAQRCFHGLGEIGHRVRLGQERLDVQHARSDRVDRLGIAVRPEVAAVNVELFGIADHCPIHGGWLVEDAELDEGAQLADHLQALDHSRGVATGLDEDIAAITLGEILHPLNSILLGHVDGDVRAEVLC